MAEYEFDIVIVGGGSAGCALAGRLARASDWRIGLIEAGPDYGPLTSGRWPPELLDPRRKPQTHDWGYAESRARVIGGCSAHNQCAAIWPLPADFDTWAEAGNPGWSYEEVRPLVDEIERDLSRASEPYRGRSGIVPTEPYPDEMLSAWHRAFMEAAQVVGIRRVHDLSAPEPAIGVTPFHANVKDSIRWNSAFAFLDPVRDRPNLSILSEMLADRLVIDKGRATELVCHARGATVRIHAECFILASGAFGSPAVLLRSGVGPARDLHALGIPVTLDLAGVGQNLQDHPGVTLALTLTEEFEHVLANEVASGRFYQSQVNARARSAHCDDGFDLHVISHQGEEGPGQWSLELMAYDMAPRSFGQVTLASRDPERAPNIDFRYLSDPGQHDLAVLEDAFRLLRRLSAVAPITRIAPREVHPGADAQSDAQVQDDIRRTVRGYGHPAGTCRMGPSSDPGAVVDAHGRLHGAENVYIADASILPRLPRANINLLCFLMGWRIGGHLLEDS